MKNVAVIFGSRSAEHDISIITAITAVIEPLKLTGQYNPIPVYITKEGNWYAEEVLGDINFYTSGDVDKKLAKFKKVNLKFDDGLWLIKAGLGGEKLKVDVAFPATHGTFGEDGSLMGLLRMADVPFVGCDLQASAVAMDKALTKIVVEAAGLPTPKYEVLLSEYAEKLDDAVKQCSKLKLPVFVKPSHLGSSIGITRATNKTELKNAIEVAFHFDDSVVVEEAVDNLVEVTVPVMGNDDNLRVALVEEALNKDAKFFDFETKYLHGGKKGKAEQEGKGGYSNLPAKIPKDLYKKCEEVAMDTYKAIGASGIARVDLLIDKKKKIVYVNEVNPLPGDLYYHNWKKAGVSNVQLVSDLVKLAYERYEKQHKLTTTFDSSFLSQF